MQQSHRKKLVDELREAYMSKVIALGGRVVMPGHRTSQGSHLARASWLPLRIIWGCLYKNRGVQDTPLGTLTPILPVSSSGC